jgi:hypothetical protein
MISLDLQEPTEEQLMTALKDAIRARNLLENEDFLWWIGKLEEGAERHQKKLVHDDEPMHFYRRQGTIKAVVKGLDELRLRAAQVEAIEERLKLYDKQPEPVARGA